MAAVLALCNCTAKTAHPSMQAMLCRLEPCPAGFKRPHNSKMPAPLQEDDPLWSQSSCRTDRCCNTSAQQECPNQAELADPKGFTTPARIAASTAAAAKPKVSRLSPAARAEAPITEALKEGLPPPAALLWSASEYPRPAPAVQGHCMSSNAQQLQASDETPSMSPAFHRHLVEHPL